MIFNLKKLICLFLVFYLFLFIVFPVLADDQTIDLDEMVTNTLRNAAGGEGAGYGTEEVEGEGFLVLYLGRLVLYSLSFLGVIFLILLIYSGILWMTAGGNEEQITKAKKLIKHSIIGLVIILAAGLISALIFEYFYRATTGQSLFL